MCASFFCHVDDREKINSIFTAGIKQPTIPEWRRCDMAFLDMLKNLTHDLDGYLTVPPQCGGPILVNISRIESEEIVSSIPTEAVQDALAELVKTENHGNTRNAVIYHARNEWLLSKLNVSVDDIVVGAAQNTSFFELLFAVSPPFTNSLLEAFAVLTIIRSFVSFVRRDSPAWRLHVMFLANFERFVDSFQYAIVIVDSRECISRMCDEWATYTDNLSSVITEQIQKEKILSLRARCLWTALNLPSMGKMLSLYPQPDLIENLF